MSRRVLLLKVHQAIPMGQQVAEDNLERALRAIAGAEWTFDSLALASLRSQDGGARVPMNAAFRMPLAASRALGRLRYPRRDLYHRLDLRCPVAPREVVTVQDLAPLHFDDEGRLPRSAAGGVRRARMVVASSQFSADEARRLGARTVRVVPNGFDPVYAEAAPASPERLAQIGVRGRFVLHAAGATARKNLEGLAAAWRIVSEEMPGVSLVLSGPRHERRDRLFRDLPSTHLVGRLETADIASLFRAADAVVVPSLYEGFGLPALEGMAAGTPVVAARRTALPEVCGDAALLVEPTGPGIADGLLRVLGDADLAARLRAAGPGRAAPFTWERAARATIEVYREALA